MQRRERRMQTRDGETVPRDASRWSYLFISGSVLALLACVSGVAGTAAGGHMAKPEVAEARPASWAYVGIPKPTPTLTDSLAKSAPPSDANGAQPTLEASATPAITMRIVEEGELGGPAPKADPGSSGGKDILVSISEQHLYAYDTGQLVYSFVASTGEGNSTRIGTFHVLDKIPNAYGATWNIWMPDWLGIYWSGTLENGIHALPILPGGARLWSGFLGTPISYGCVVLGVDEATQLYSWADIGTPVEIRY